MHEGETYPHGLGYAEVIPKIGITKRELIVGTLLMPPALASRAAVREDDVVTLAAPA